jgi:hypothetical protein
MQRGSEHGREGVGWVRRRGGCIGNPKEGRRAAGREGGGRSRSGGRSKRAQEERRVNWRDRGGWEGCERKRIMRRGVRPEYGVG